MHELIAEIASCWNNPKKFALLAWPWGVEGGPLVKYDGPDQWQIDLFDAIKEGIDSGNCRRFSVGSGHGIGKTAAAVILINWFLATRINPAVVVTANTGDQLRLKTWRELSKWHSMMIEPIKSWFEWTATAYRLKDRPELWGAVAQTWSVDNAEAFAGTHESSVLFITDESSAIPDIIDDNIEGAMSTEGAIRVSFGNRTRASGWFSRTFKPGLWASMSVSSRSARHADKKWIDEMVGLHGEESDFVRVRIDGLEPKAGFTNFLPLEDIDKAMSDAIKGEVFVGSHEPIVLGIDVARFGDDTSCAFLRHGRTEIRKEIYSGLDNAELARSILMDFGRYELDAINVDGTGGYGSGVVDILRDVHRVPNVNEINFSSKSPDPDFYNMRSYIYERVRQELRRGFVLQKDDVLREELAEFSRSFKGNKLILEAKDDIKKSLGRSPDRADAFALTFAIDVLRHQGVQSPEGIQVSY